MSELPDDAAAEWRRRRGHRWPRMLLGAVMVVALVAAPVIHTTRTGPGEVNCSAGTRSEVDIVFVLDSSEQMSSSDPGGLRKSATTALVNGMGATARAAVVDFDDRGQVVQDLTSDKGDLIGAINAIDNSGGADLAAGIRATLGAFSDDPGGDRDQTIVLITDGKGAYETSLTSEAAAAGVQIFTVGLGPSADSTTLNAIAKETGGTYSSAAPLLGPQVVKGTESPLGRDTDRDGLSDCDERHGAWNARGERHITDFRNPDSDGDGLTDGQEVTNDPTSFGASAASGLLQLPLGIEEPRYIVSNPNLPDSDGDGAADALEFDLGTQPFVRDSDGDGLGDFEEVNEHGTNPSEPNTDSDARDDGWEVENASSGFAPTIFDKELSKLSFARDFAAGATCPEGLAFCETDSVAFLAGSIASGFFGYKDVLDLVANLSTLDFVGAGLAATALVPVAGDAAAVVSKAVRFLNRVPAQTQVDGLAYLARADSLPISARMDVLNRFDEDSVNVLRGQGMTDERIIALVGSRVDFRVFSRAVQGATRVEKSPQLYALEKEAQTYLGGQTSGALLEESFRCPGCLSRSTLGSRRVDVYDPTSRTATEVKNGYALLSTTRDEVAKDVALLADPGTPIDKIVWHFYPKEGGGVGPDDGLRELLMSSGIPYVVSLP